MNPETLSLIAALGFLIPLLAAGVQIGVVLALSAALGSIVYTGSWASGPGLLLIQSVDVTSAYTFMVIPMFIAMGTIAGRAQITSDLFAAFYRWIGHVPGGVAVATVGTCAGMAAITGSSLASSAAMAKIAMPELRRLGYNERLSAGTISMGGTLAIMIPPSITLVLYGIIAEQSIGQMLIAGVIPGLLTATFYAVKVYVRCRLKPELGPPGPRSDWNERFRSVLPVIPFSFIIAAIVLGILFGIWTPTESAAGGLILVIAMALVRRSLSVQSLYDALSDAVVVSASVMLVVIGSLMFGNFIALNGAAEGIKDGIINLQLAPFSLFLLLIVIYLVLGCFLEATSILALTVPIVLPVVIDMGWNPIWFGVVLVSLMEIASVTPPVGLNLFVMKATLPELSLSTIFLGAAPFWAVNIVVLFLLYFQPQLALYLPDLMLR